MPDLTPEQQAIFDAEIESLRERLDWRKAIMALPSLKQRAAALKSLRVAVSSVRRASRSKALQTAGLFSYQTEQWLDDAQAVADELRKLTKPPRNPVLARGMTRPNRYIARGSLAREFRRCLRGSSMALLFPSLWPARPRGSVELNLSAVFWTHWARPAPKTRRSRASWAPRGIRRKPGRRGIR